MSNQTKNKRKNKKYQGQKNVRNSIGRVYATFNPIIEWFELQLNSGETVVDGTGEPCVITHKSTLCPTWQAIEAMIDYADTAREKAVFDVSLPDLEAFKRALKFDSLVPESLFKRAFSQLLKLRNAVFKMNPKMQVTIAEITKARIMATAQQEAA